MDAEQIKGAVARALKEAFEGGEATCLELAQLMLEMAEASGLVVVITLTATPDEEEPKLSFRFTRPDEVVG